MAENKLNDIKEQYDVVLFIPEKQEYIGYSEGTGDNLQFEDAAAGYIDYIDYTQYDAECEEVDGGMYMMKEYFRDKYLTEDYAAADLVEFVYGEKYSYDVKQGFME